VRMVASGEFKNVGRMPCRLLGYDVVWLLLETIFRRNIVSVCSQYASVASYC
jgi:hypothetical protein